MDFAKLLSTLPFSTHQPQIGSIISCGRVVLIIIKLKRILANTHIMLLSLVIILRDILYILVDNFGC